LAVAGAPLVAEPAAVEVWNLETGRGTLTLTGLAGPIAKTAFSTDGRYVAALSQQWQLGVWDLSVGRLMHVLDGPRGNFVDNAALAFDPAAVRLACAGGTEAILWDLATGRRLNHWQLPSGLQDALAFEAAGRQLWSVRCETETGVPPYSEYDFRQHRRIYPVRNLLGPEPTKALTAIPSADDHIKGIVMTPDARAVVLNTWRKLDGGEQHTVRAFSLPSGTDLWRQPVVSGDLRMDPLGKLLAFAIDRGDLVIAALDSGATIRRQTGILGPAGTWFLQPDNRLGVGNAIVAGLDIDQQIAMGSQFSPCGRYLATGRQDGTVIVYELEAFRKHLAEFGNR
jgi:WD40 repeat protein